MLLNENRRESAKPQTVSNQIPLFTQPFIQTQIKENIKAPRHWPLCGEFTWTGEFPAQRVGYAENVSIWWRHHGILLIEVEWRYMPSLVKMMACRLVGAKPLSKPVLEYC